MDNFKMKDYHQFLNEKYASLNMSVFDIDDTLVITRAKIKVFDPHTSTEYALTPAEYNSYERQAHHKLDFSEFDDSDLLLNGRPIEWVFNILKKTMNKQKAVGVITARGDKQIVIDFLQKHGVQINPDYVFAINDPKCKYTGNNAERKQQAFKDLIDLGFRNFKFFDDNLDNLAYAKKLEHEYPDVRVTMRHIKDIWIPKFND